MDRRHLRRQKIVQDLFTSMFTYDEKDTVHEYHEKTFEILKHKDEIDDHVIQYAQKYDAENIAKVDLAILRLSIYELLYEKKVPPKVIINEAVELAKELGSEKSPSFVNAILGKIYEETPTNTD